MKKVWPKFKDNQDILEYMPILPENGCPPRKYFFEILHSAFEDEFNQLIDQVKRERTQKKREKNKVIRVSPNLLDEIKSLNRDLG